MSRTNKFIFIGFIIAILGLAPMVLVTAQAPTAPIQDMQALIRQLQEQIRAMQTQIRELKTELHEMRVELKLTRSLQRGARGEDVEQLQGFLKRFPEIYPDGSVTGYFGERTEEAVKKFQDKHGVEPVGVVGPKTRERLMQEAERFSGPPSKTSYGAIPAKPAIRAVPGESPAIPAERAIPAQPVQPYPQYPPIPPPPTVEQTQRWASEQVKCIFKGSTAVQECVSSASYGGQFACKGIETCVTDVKGYLEEQITWKSTCGGYAYTKIDGQNDYAEFNCGAGVLEAQKFPDLTVFDIFSDAGKLSIKVGNIGSASAPETGHLYIWIDGTLKWTYSFSTFADKSFLLSGGTWVVQPQVLSGSHSIKAFIDANNAIRESNENNNVLEKVVDFSTSQTYSSSPVATVQQVVKVLSPNGGEKIPQGSIFKIQWSSSYLSSKSVNISLLQREVDNSWTYWTTIATNVPQSSETGTFTYEWKVLNFDIDRDFYIEISGADGQTSPTDRSDAAFQFTTDYRVNIVSPNGGESWSSGTSQLVRWTATRGQSFPTDIVLLKGGVKYRTLATAAMVDYFDGTAYVEKVMIPADVAAGSDYTIEIVVPAIWTTIPEARDVSDNPFSIGAPSTSLVPNSGSRTQLAAALDSFEELLNLISRWLEQVR